MPTLAPRDRFDEVLPDTSRVGAHRAENPKVGGWRAFLASVGIVVLVVAVGIVGSLISEGRLGFGSSEPAEAVPVDVVPVVDTSFSVLVLNGSGVTGAGEGLRSLLTQRGWTSTSVSTGNTGSPAETTTVYYAAPEARAAALGLAEIVGTSSVVEDAAYPFSGVSPTQLTVVLGADYVPAEGAEPVLPSPSAS